jgi:hypothetical protein
MGSEHPSSFDSVGSLGRELEFQARLADRHAPGSGLPRRHHAVRRKKPARLTAHGERDALSLIVVVTQPRGAPR